MQAAHEPGCLPWIRTQRRHISSVTTPGVDEKSDAIDIRIIPVQDEVQTNHRGKSSTATRTLQSKASLIDRFWTNRSSNYFGDDSDDDDDDHTCYDYDDDAERIDEKLAVESRRPLSHHYVPTHAASDFCRTATAGNHRLRAPRRSSSSSSSSFSSPHQHQLRRSLTAAPKPDAQKLAHHNPAADTSCATPRRLHYTHRPAPSRPNSASSTGGSGNSESVGANGSRPGSKSQGGGSSTVGQTQAVGRRVSQYIKPPRGQHLM